MKRRKLGDTGIEASEVGVGGWQLGGNPEWGGQPDQDESVRIVHEALAQGVNFFDTAPDYAEGRSEALLGRALAGRRDEAVLCTKFGHHGAGGFDAGRLAPSVEGSLMQLRTDYLDVLLLHSPPPELHDGATDEAAPIYAELDRLQQEGKIRAYGVSVDSGDELERVVATTGSRVCEVLFNAFFQEPAAAMERAAAADIGLVGKVPLDSGWLSGNYRASATFDDVRSRWSAEMIERRAALVEKLASVLPEGTSTRQAALRFVLAHSAVSTVIPGVRSVAQLQENLAAVGEELPEVELEAIRQVWRDEISGDPLDW